MPSRDEIREKFLKAIDAYRLENNERGLGMLDIEPTVDHLMSLVDEHIAEAMAGKFKDYLEGLEVTEAAHLIAVTMYLYCMEKTNATEVKFKLDGFNKSGKVLGDMTVSAQLSTEPLEREQ